jgi:hypothetical protein
LIWPSSPRDPISCRQYGLCPARWKALLYYRRAFFPGVAHRSEAAVVTVDAGGTVDNLRFFLPPDALPTIPLEVTVLGFDGNPVPHAALVAYDNTWENNVNGYEHECRRAREGRFTLRSGSHYDIAAVVNLPDASKACAEPLGVDAHDSPATVVLVLSHHFGDCWQFKKQPTNSLDRGAAAPPQT